MNMFLTEFWQRSVPRWLLKLYDDWVQFGSGCCSLVVATLPGRLKSLSDLVGIESKLLLSDSKKFGAA